jgi:Zn-dependent protease
MGFILSILIVVILLAGVMFTLNFLNIARMRLKKPLVELREETGLPEYLNSLFKPAEEQLGALGFVRLGCLYRDSFIAHEMSGKWSVLLGQKDESAYAEVTLTAIQAEMPGYEVSFATIFTDDVMVQTLNCRKHGLFVEVPKVLFVDPCVPTIEQQWQAHRQKVAEVRRGKTPFPLWTLLYVARQQLSGEQMIEEADAQGVARPTTEGEYAFNLRHALPLAWKLITGLYRMAPVQRLKRKKADAAGETVPVEVEVESFLRVQSIAKKKPLGRLGKTVILLASVMLFAVSMGITLSFRSVLLLLAVVMFHELGHFLGMYFCGYRNLQVMFVPFLGALAYGEEHRAKPFQRVIVLLLGPLPGLILGAAGIAVNAHLHADWLRELTLFLLTLNLFNLLPIMPLDGGQLVQVLLFQRFPRIQSLFHILSTLLLGTWALISDDAVLRTLAILMGLSIPLQWRQGRALAWMKKGLADFREDERQRLAHFFSVLRDKPFARMPFQKKMVIVKTAERELLMGTASWRLTLATLCLYGLAVIGPFAVIIGTGPLRLGAPATAAESRPQPADWDAKIERAATPTERYSLLIQAGEWWEEEAPDRAAGYYEKAGELARTFGDNDIRVAKSCLALATVVEMPRAGALLEQALKIQEQKLGASHPDLALTLQRLADVSPPAAALPHLERRLAILEQTKEGTSPEVVTTLRQLVVLYDSEQRDREAERTVLHCRELLLKNPGQAGLEPIQRDFAIYYAMHDRLDEAAKLLQEPLAQTTGYRTGQLKEELGWVYLAQGKGDDAVKVLEETLAEQRAAQKTTVSRQSLGLVNYLLVKIMQPAVRKQYSEETGASLRDVRLLVDLAVVALALERTDQARGRFQEAQQLIKTFGNGTGIESILRIAPGPGGETTEGTDFLQSWTQKKILARKQVLAQFQR